MNHLHVSAASGWNLIFSASERGAKACFMSGAVMRRDATRRMRAEQFLAVYPDFLFICRAGDWVLSHMTAFISSHVRFFFVRDSAEAQHCIP